MRIRSAERIDNKGSGRPRLWRRILATGQSHWRSACKLVTTIGALTALGNACSATNDGSFAGATGGAAGNGTGGGVGTTMVILDAAPDSTADLDAGFVSDVTSEESPITPDAACAAVAEEAEATALPVDIIWVIDNSASMAAAITQVQQGLVDFANLIEAKSLDYHVIMLSLRSKTSPVTIGGSTRYPVCIPVPLAGDDNCADGPRFFQSSIDIRSTQPLEQLLGTLGQTAGYQPTDAKGGVPWADKLRPEATKTIVVVSDDNARLSATDFETFAGGKNPFNSLTLPPGILDASWNGLFTGYLFSGIYGWGSTTDPSVKCTFSDQTQPASSGTTYTTLVGKTGGVRAKICDGPAAWQPFFDAVAQAVFAAAKLSCELAIPAPSTGVLDPSKVNVAIGNPGSETYLFGVANAGACGTDSGWYYDDPANPTKVLLCPAACEAAQQFVGPGKPGKVEVLFGCETILK